MSVIVPTRNSAASLLACLLSIESQEYEPLELIVVDNGSTDDTVSIAQALADRTISAGPERSAQRNRGACEARGRFLFFVDSDMILEPEVVRECVAAAQARPGVVVIVPEKSIGRGFWARCKALERSCYIGDDSIEAARFFPRETFEAVSGYDEGLHAAEDWDLHLRVLKQGAATSRTNAFILHDEGDLRLPRHLHKKYRYGREMGSYIQRHPNAARRQLRLLRPAFVRHWRRLASRPTLAAGMMFMKACEFAAGALGLAVSRALDSRKPASQGLGQETE